MVQTRTALAGVPLERAMMTEFRTLRGDDHLSDAADALLAGPQHDFPVLDDNGDLSGLLTRTRLIDALSRNGSGSLVSEIMMPEIFSGG